VRIERKRTDLTGEELAMRTSTVETWAGPFTVVVDGDGAVLASGWTADAGALLALVHPSLRRTEPDVRKDLGEITKAVRAYHDGDVRAVDAHPVRQHSDGAFLTTAWQVLRGVEPGQPISYAEFARLTGNPAASRAAAQACARNAAALFVPCHRILRSDGSLGGFRWGTNIKRRLLDHELRAAESS
jgi:methylated-DNA-[protein]-cysteine S-methyltransferase